MTLKNQMRSMSCILFAFLAENFPSGYRINKVVGHESFIQAPTSEEARSSSNLHKRKQPNSLPIHIRDDYEAEDKDCRSQNP